MATITFSRIKRGCFSARWGVIGTLFFCLSFGTSSFPDAPAKTPYRSHATITEFGRLPPVPQRKIQILVANLVSPSLEMKENVDFLLTPAILVQEAISSGVVPTYPTE